MSEQKVTVLPYISPRCVVCGRDLPKGRRQKCHSADPQRHTSRRWIRRLIRTIPWRTGWLRLKHTG